MSHPYDLTDDLTDDLPDAPALDELDGEPEAADDGTYHVRRDVVDRRSGLDRKPERTGKGDRRETGLERRRGAGIRRDDDRRSAEEGEMTDEQLQFVMAIEAYKKVNKKLFPTWTEVLEVVRQLGYRPVAEPTIHLSPDFRGGREERASVKPASVNPASAKPASAKLQRRAA